MRSAASSASSMVVGRNVASITNQTLQIDHAWNDRGRAHLEDSDRRLRVVAYVAGDLQPGPLEPARVLREPQPGGRRVPLMDAAGVEHQRPVDSLDEGSVRVPEHDCVRVREPRAQHARQPGVRVVCAQAQGPQQGLRLLDPAAAVAMDDDDAFAFDSHVFAKRPAGALRIVVAANDFDQSEGRKGGDGPGAVDVPGMDDQIHTAKDFEHAIREAIHELRAMGVGDDPDAKRQAAARGAGRRASSTTNGARLRTAAIPKTADCPTPKASAPRGGPNTPPR